MRKRKNNKLKMLLLFLALIICISIIGSASAADLPSANFTSNSTNGSDSLVVRFNDTSTGDPTTGSGILVTTRPQPNKTQFTYTTVRVTTTLVSPLSTQWATLL